MVDNCKSAESSAPRSASEILCSNLSHGLHAAAQPLTILRFGLANDRIKRMSIGELRELVASSAVEVERVCMLFSCLRDLVTTDSIEPKLSATLLLPLLTTATDDVKSLFKRNGVFLKSTAPDIDDLVLIDSARTLQVFSSVLLLAHSISRAQDPVELMVSSPSSNAVRAIVQNLNSYIDKPSAEVSLNMAHVEANIQGQKAGFSWSLQPFRVQIDFRKAPATQ